MKSLADRIEQDMARFEHKGPGIRQVGSDHFDIMAGEFNAYRFDIGSEEDALTLGREARDLRLVGTKSGQVARAVGSLSDGTGYLLNAQGQPVNRTPQAPITPMKRKAADW